MRVSLWQPDSDGEAFDWRGATVYVRPMCTAARRFIRSQAGLPERQPAGEQLTEEQTAALAHAAIDYQLAGWDDLNDQDGEPIPTTLAAKLALVESFDDLAADVQRWAQLDANARRIERINGELGNTSDSSPRDGTQPPVGTSAAVGATTAAAR